MQHFDYLSDSAKTSKEIVDSGTSLNYKSLSLCRLDRLVGPFYQVDCLDRQLTYSNLYTDFTEAFNKFIYLKERLEYVRGV